MCSRRRWEKFPWRPFGLYDMTGNVSQWCADYYDPKYYTISAKEDPENITTSGARVLRGGSFVEMSVRHCRAANRIQAKRWGIP